MCCCRCACGGGVGGGPVTEAEFRAGVLETLISIRTSIETLAQAIAQPDEERPAATAELGACTHPDDARVQFGGMGGSEDWQCRLCGHRPVKES
jgi:hypothetical protein